MPQITDVRRALRFALPAELDAEVRTGPQEPQKTFGGRLGPALMIVRVYVGHPGSEGVEERLDELLDSGEEGSVYAALYADQTLGGVVSRLRVLGTSGWRTWERVVRAPDGVEKAPVLGAEWTVEVSY